MFVTENPSVTTEALALPAGVPVRLLCTVGTPSAVEVPALARLADSGRRIAVRGDFDTAGLALVRAVLDAMPEAEAWRMTADDYTASLHPSPFEPVLWTATASATLRGIPRPQRPCARAAARLRRRTHRPTPRRSPPGLPARRRALAQPHGRKAPATAGADLPPPMSPCSILVSLRSSPGGRHGCGAPCAPQQRAAEAGAIRPNRCRVSVRRKTARHTYGSEPPRPPSVAR
ncbi:DUF2399 domain-containing protein [Streptomyces sp. NPDC048664]|uniref:DUF2399 domain-containing protein n=1 Tax=Streptomyces sp. NPDC048664 TaxID=3154505 RepID=UPI0034146614